MAGVPTFRSQVSAIRSQARVIRFRFGARINRFSPLSSIQSSIHFGWPVAGATKIRSALHSVLNAVLHSALRDRFSPLSSVIDSALYSFRVAGGSPRWPVAGFSIQPSIQPSIQSSTQSSIQPSVIDSAILGQHAVLTLPQDRHSPDTRHSKLDTLRVPTLPDQLQHLLGQQRHA